MNNTNITDAFLEKIQRADNDFCLFGKAKRILVGLSGGADSVSLVLSLRMLSEKYGFSLCALHVNHMIRGSEADRDEEFSRSLCKKYGIEFLCERIDVPKLCEESGQSLELCARNARYAAFERACRQTGAELVATAHNACDNAETVVFNLVRGSGIRGLCGIPPRRSLCEGVTVIRPLIYIGREEIEAFLKCNEQDYVTDSTNLETDYTRNFIRREVLPLLRRINPSLEDGIAKTSMLHRQDEEYLTRIARQSLTDELSRLSELDVSILSRVVMELFANVCDEMPSAYHIKSLCEKIYSHDGKRTCVSFPCGMTAVLEKGRLNFEKDKRGESDLRDFEKPLCEKEMFFEENPYALYISLDGNKDIPKTLSNGENVYKKYTVDYLYFDTIPSVLFVRNRRDGDKIRSAGMNKSVKRLLNGTGLTERERYLLPFVCGGDGILLIPGVAVSDGCRRSGENRCGAVVALYRK